MKKSVYFALIVTVSLFLVNCASVSKNGYSKPTIFTNPLSYLDSFPLNEVTKNNLVEHLGLPDKTNELDGKTYYSYEIGEGYGKRQYIYELTNGVVTDVRYNDQGPYNGSSAKQRQNK